MKGRWGDEEGKYITWSHSRFRSSKPVCGRPSDLDKEIGPGMLSTGSGKEKRTSTHVDMSKPQMFFPKSSHQRSLASVGSFWRPFEALVFGNERMKFTKGHP